MTTFGNLEIMTPEDTERSAGLASTFLSELLIADRIPERGDDGISFALGASAGQMLFMASARRFPKDPEAQLGFVAGLASGFVSALYQAIGPAAAVVIGQAMEAGLNDGLDRCSTLYGGRGKSGSC